MQLSHGVLFAQSGASPAPTPNPFPINSDAGSFVPDAEVTQVGKDAVRSEDFLDWVLAKGTTPQNGDTPLQRTWRYVEQATYALSALMVVAVGFWFMIRRDKDIKVMRFLPLLVVLMVYIFFSYTIIHLIYSLTEGLIHNFLTIPNGGCESHILCRKDLLDINFPYLGFQGARRAGTEFDESAAINLLLVRLTTWTYMAMSGILIIRQVILWFFIIVSPLLALLFPFPLIRNTAKIWIGEFFRWLCYGILLAMFLRGLVIMWQNGIPMQFRQDDPAGWSSTLQYPTATNILIAGPNYHTDKSVDAPTGAASTNINLVDTYANYVVALIMLWVVIILPWILLRIFRDMFTGWLKSDGANGLMSQLGSVYSKYAPGGGGRARTVPSPPSPQPEPLSPSPAGAGRALELPFRKVNIVARDVAVNQDIKNENVVNIDREISQAQTTDLSRFLGMAIPKITDVARMEMNTNQMSQAWSNLQKLGNPNLAKNPQEVQHISAMRAELSRRAASGDDKASSILRAAESASAASASSLLTTRGRSASSSAATAEQVQTGAQKGAAAIAAAVASQSGGPHAASVVARAAQSTAGGRVMPVVNKMQSVSLSDYEDVKKMWLDHYKNGEVPLGANTNSREEWIKMDVQKAEVAIGMLGNINPQVKQKGLEMVAALLPFLLLGGFSEQETITYLKAKVEAAKQTLAELEAEHKGEQKTKEEEEEQLSVENKKEATAEKHMEAEPEDLEDLQKGPGQEIGQATQPTTSQASSQATKVDNDELAAISQIANEDVSNIKNKK